MGLGSQRLEKNFSRALVKTSNFKQLIYVLGFFIRCM